MLISCAKLYFKDKRCYIYVSVEKMIILWLYYILGIFCAWKAELEGRKILIAGARTCRSSIFATRRRTLGKSALKAPRTASAATRVRQQVAEANPAGTHEDLTAAVARYHPWNVTIHPRRPRRRQALSSIDKTVMVR